MTLRNLRVPAPETWHERFMRLGAAKDYAGCLAMLRAPIEAAGPESLGVPQDALKSKPTSVADGSLASVGTEGSAVEGDIVLLNMAQALHAGVRDEPFARMDFSDAQWARLEAAAGVIREPLLALLRAGWTSGDKRLSPVLLEKEMGCSFIWVVWAVKPGAVRLLAVCSDERRADHYCANLPPGLSEFKAWKERAPLDHGFGFADSMHARVQGKL